MLHAADQRSSSAPSKSPYPRQRGATLVEALAALLVIAVGVIGVAALHLDRSAQNAESELQRSAVELAEDIAARIRNNPEGRLGYVSSIGVVCGRDAKSASARDQAAHEASCWRREVESRLPSGLGSISRDVTATPENYVVAVSWSAPGGGAASYVIRLGAEALGGG